MTKKLENLLLKQKKCILIYIIITLSIRISSQIMVEQIGML